MKTFKKFISEDAVMGAPSVTAGVENYQSPIGTENPTAKKKIKPEDASDYVEADLPK